MTAHEIFLNSFRTAFLLFFVSTFYFVVYHPPKPEDAKWYHIAMATSFFGSIAAVLISSIGLIWT